MSNSYELAERIHRSVNFGTEYLADIEQYGRPEHWVEAGRFGDCEDYALAKRALLKNQGWPADKMSLCICGVDSPGDHCVLFVDTDLGGYILDNRREWPTKPTDLPYRWDSMLMGGKWYEIRGWHSA